MYLRPSDSAAPLQLPTQRKRDLVEHFEANSDELARWREFNAAYHQDDFKFMRFLIPPGKRVLELGCGRGDLLVALEPSKLNGQLVGPRRSMESVVPPASGTSPRCVSSTWLSAAAACTDGNGTALRPVRSAALDRSSTSRRSSLAFRSRATGPPTARQKRR